MDGRQDLEETVPRVDEASSQIYSTLRQGLEAARSKLLDRSLRNKLIHTNIASPKARQVRVIDEKTEQVFAILRSGRVMTFAPAQKAGETDDDPQDAVDEGVYIPVIEDALDDRGVAARHRDQKLQTRLTREGLQKRLLSLFLEGQSIEDEQGVNILYLALGFLEWREARQSDIARYAPLLLLPVELVRDGAKDTFKLKLRLDDLFTNFSMQAWLKEQFDIDLPELPEDDEWSPGSYFSAVKEAIGDRKGWSVREDEIILGFFSFAKFLLWRDLDPANWPTPETLTGNDLLRRILLREDKDELVDTPLVDDSERIDAVFKPADLVHIADCDSSQAIAIQEALAGKNLVIQGPPGTGKSQTITNLIAGAVAQGKKVLFIAEKMPALNVVHDRLVKAKLGVICLELHSRKASKAQVLEQITQGMNAPAPPSWSFRVFEELEQTAGSLTAHTDRLHLTGQNGLSAFQLMGKLALLKGKGTATPDFAVEEARDWSEADVEDHGKRVSQLAERIAVAGTPSRHPWRGIGIETPDMLEQDRLRPLLTRFENAAARLGDAANCASKVLAGEGSPSISALEGWIEPLSHLANAPKDCDVLLADDRLRALTQALEEAAENGERAIALRPLVTPHLPVFDALLPDSPKIDLLIAAWLHLGARPDGVDALLTDDQLSAVADQVLQFVDDNEQFETVWKTLGPQVTADALAIDWAPARKIIAGLGRSPFRIFSRDYKNALRTLRSVSRGDIPTDHAKRLVLLDALIDCRRCEAAIKADLISSILLGDLWRGKRSDWPRIRAVVDWVAQAKAFEPALGLRTQGNLDLATTARDFPSVPSEQRELIGHLQAHRALIAGLDDARDCAELLDRRWKGADSDWKTVRLMTRWVTTATDFEPDVKLRELDVLANADSAAAISRELTGAISEARVAFDGLSAALHLTIDESVVGGPFRSRSPQDLLSVAKLWSSNFQRLPEWPPVRDDLTWLSEVGCRDFAERVSDGRVPVPSVLDVFLLAAYEAAWGNQRKSVPEVERTRGDQLSTYVTRFRKADLDRIAVASDQVARAHIDQRPSGSAGAVGILKDEAKKARRHKPVRRLMEEAGEAIQRFKPVFLMSPLSVAQFLKPGRLSFDVCVIDEASQIRPEDALGAIARCKQVVVVGDDKQLPPTNFFNRIVDDEPMDDDDFEGDVRAAAVKDVESILNLCSRFPERMLSWHYRSEHPALIATSNRNFYKNQLFLPPSVLRSQGDGETGLRFHQVQPGGYDRGKTATNEIEAAAVVNAVVNHARKCPDLTLGICTFSGAQRDAIRNLLEVAEAKTPELDAFTRRHRAAGQELFVRNLENVQGDERDVIFISVGYGKDASGKMTQGFGPVGREGGGRRLNVLITRAKKRCEVFSSIVAEDIRSEGGKPGVLALKEFLKLARDGFADFATTTGKGFDSDFEESVGLAIRALGYEMHPQVGMAGFFIDIALIDPANPDRYILGIECDGAAYHSSKYSRDRDRLRQEILERRGWKIHRIWSTDWFYQKEREVEKLREAIERAISGKSIPVASEVYGYEVDEDQSEAPRLSEGAVVDFELNGRLPQYVFYESKARERHSHEPHELSNTRLAELVIDIVAVEQPIHQEEVARRLASAFDRQKAGSRIQDAALGALRYAAKQKLLDSKGYFWSLAGAAEDVARDRSGLESAATVRKAAMIAPAEWAAAARHALVASLALEEEELAVETARLLGFARTGKDVNAAISSAIQSHLSSEIEQDHLRRLRLRT